MANTLPFGWKKLTPNRKAYLRQVERIREIEARTGKTIDIKTPQYIRKKDIQKLGKVRTEDVMSKGREMPNQEGVVLNHLQEMIDTLNINSLQDVLNEELSTEHISEHMQTTQSMRQSILKEILEEQIKKDGEEAVARRLNDRSSRRLVELAQNAIFPSDEDLAVASMIEFANLIKGEVMSVAEAEILESQYEEAFKATPK